MTMNKRTIFALAVFVPITLVVVLPFAIADGLVMGVITGIVVTCRILRDAPLKLIKDARAHKAGT